MKTQITKSLGLVLVMAIGVLMAMLALGTFSDAKPEAVHAGTQAQGATGVPATMTAPATGVSVSNDGTIFVISDDTDSDEADTVRDDIYISTNGGTSFSVVSSEDADGDGTHDEGGEDDQPWNGTAITEIVPSPNYGADSNVFLIAGAVAYRSVTRGVADAGWEQIASDTASSTADAAITDLSVAPNFNATGEIAVAVVADGAGDTPVVKVTCDSSGFDAVTADDGACDDLDGGATPDIADATGAVDIGDGVIAVEFSPNYESDGTIMVVAIDEANDDLCNTTFDTCENRSVNAADFADGNEVSIAAAVQGSAVIAFPSDFNANSNNNYWVGTTRDTAGSVFRRSSGAWADEAPCGTANACPTTDLVSNGTFAAGTVFAGMKTASSSETQLFRSTDGGKTWNSSAILLGGTGGNMALALSPDYATDSTVYAATAGTAGAFYASTTGGGSAGAFTAKGMFTDTYATIKGIDADPADGSPMFAVYAGSATGDDAVFRTTSATSSSAKWTRTGTIAGADVTNVRVSIDYANDTTVYLAGGTTLQRSTNGGESFTSSGSTQIPQTVLVGVGLAVADTDTVFAAATNKVHYSNDSGTTWSSVAITGTPTITDIEVSPDYANDSTVLVAARTAAGAAQAFLSEDGGATYTMLGTHKDTSTGTGEHVVGFDSNYATNSTLYSGTDSNLYRWVQGTSTAWTELDPDDDGGGTQGGEEVSGISSSDGILSVSFQGTDDVMRALTPTGTYDGATKLQWYNLGWVNNNSTANAARGDGTMDQSGSGTFGLTGAGFIAVPTSSTTYTWFGVNTGAAPDTLRSYKDVTLAAPTVTSPADAASLTSAPDLSWAPYTALTSAIFTVRVSTNSDFSDVLATSYTNVAASTYKLASSGLTVPAFTSGNTYYWQVAAISSDGAVTSPWSAVQTYIASAGEPGLLYPVSSPGSRQAVPSVTPGLSWTAVAAATDYRIQIATDPTIVSSGGSYVTAVKTDTVGSATPAYQIAAGDLSYDTVYYWQVQAIFGTASGNYTNLGPPPYSGGTSSNSGVFQTPVEVVAATATPTPVPAVATATATVAANLITADPAIKIVGYNTTAGAFQFYDASLAADHPAQDLETLTQGDGVWINNSTDANITAEVLGRDMTLVPGWNLKGL
jgi:hypothetical protein